MTAAAAGFNLFGLTTAQFETFLFVLVRTTAIMSMVPIFSASQIPRLVRVSIGLILTLVLIHVVPTIKPVDGLGGLVAGVFSQLFVGVVFGFIAFLVFTGIQFAGEIIDIQIGYAVVNIINPITQAQVTVIGELELALATLIYLAADAHHYLIEGLAGSFNLVPLPFAYVQAPLMQDVVGFFTQALLLIFQIAAPVSLALFVTNVGLALMARVAPQMNIFAVGFPLQIGIGLIMLIIAMPLLVSVLPGVYAELPSQLDAALRRMAPSPAP